uniref:Uncharacterized protein n=1 Tax=Zea mays TaxID=4577 RepID=A0A804QPY1_MAIZE
MEEGGRTEELPVQWRAHFEHFFIHLQAYLPYGIPRLMQKVVYTVGGHLFSAVFIEYVILKMKSPSHRPQMFPSVNRGKLFQGISVFGSRLCFSPSRRSRYLRSRKILHYDT